MRCDEKAWYAMRVTYSREVKLKKYLDQIQVESFLPMKYTAIQKQGRQVKEFVPVVHNLIFINSSKIYINQIKPKVESIASIRYIMDKATNSPIVVPYREMQNFITVAGSMNEQLIYLTPQEINLKRGDKVEITGGSFSGIIGEIIKIKRQHHVVVSIKGFMAVATASIPTILLKKVALSPNNN